MRDALRQLLGDARVRELRGFRVRRLELGLAEQLRECLGEGCGARAEGGDRGLGVERAAAVAQQPAGRPLEQDARLQHHRDLRRRGDLAVERLDLRPEAAQPEHLAGGNVRARDVGGAGARLVAEPEREGRAGAVDEVVGNARDDDLAPERMPLQLRSELLPQARREVQLQLVRERRVLGQVGREQLLREHDLRVREQDRELGRRQAAARGLALLQHLVAREELELAVQQSGLLEVADVTLVHLDHRRRLRRRARDRLGLLVVVAQDERADLVLHLGEDGVALLLGQVAVGDDRVEQDLDVDLVIGAIDARRVVDRVHEDPAAAQRVCHARALREAEVAALADDAAAQLVGVDPDGVVRLVADLGVPLLLRLHVRPDAAVPEQVDRRLQDRAHDLVRRRRLGLDPERGARLRREGDRLRRAREHAAARRDQLRVVVGPGRGR